ncbi:STAS domain-containing protein [Aurantivibrio plasticivorans]
MKDIYETISVPFVSEEMVERAESDTKSNIEELLEAEFGESHEFIITPNTVQVGSTTLIDLDADAIFAQTPPSKKTKQTDPHILRDFDRPTLPASEDAMVFTSRVIANRQTLRIAVHSDLVQLYRPAVNSLLADVRRKREDHIEVDLARCKHISLTGIGVLLLIKENAPHKCDVTLKNCEPEIYKKLRWANLESAFTINTKKSTTQP